MAFAQVLRSAGRLLAGALVVVATVSCSSGGSTTGSTTGAADPAPDPAGDRVASVLPGNDSGLMIRQWRVADDADVVARALMRYARGEGGDPESRRALARNGFRLVRVAAADVEALLEDLGDSSLDVDGWHGQAYEWRALAAKSLGPGGRAVAVDGHVRRLSGGRVRLMMRGWTAQMEDGPVVYLELQPDFDQSRRSRLTHVLARPRFIGERFGSMGLDLMLETGYAYVLTAAGPGEDWSTSVPLDAEAPAVPAAPERSAPGPSPGPGPAGAGTPTVGEVLLRTEAIPARRDVFVFVPRIPAALYPSARRMPGEAEASR